jgi:hypothetical protein
MRRSRVCCADAPGDAHAAATNAATPALRISQAAPASRIDTHLNDFTR